MNLTTCGSIQHVFGKNENGTVGTAPSGINAYLSGVERRCRFTSTFLPSSVIQVYGLTGTIFFPFFVFDIIKVIKKTCNMQTLLHQHGLRECQKRHKILGYFRIFFNFNNFYEYFLKYFKKCRIFAAYFSMNRDMQALKAIYLFSEDYIKNSITVASWSDSCLKANISRFKKDATVFFVFKPF